MGLLIKKFFMQIVIWLFNLIDSIFGVFRTLAGIESVGVVGDTEMTLTEYFFSQSVLYQVFFGIIICSIGLLAVCMVVSIVKSIVNFKGGERKPHSRTIGQGFGSVLVTLVIAIIMVVGISASDKLLGTLYNTMNINDLTVGQTIFDLSVSETYPLDTNNEQGLNYPYSLVDGEPVKDNDGMVAYKYRFVVGGTYANGLQRFYQPDGITELPQDQVWIPVEVIEGVDAFVEVDGSATYDTAYRGTDGGLYALLSGVLTIESSTGWRIAGDNPARTLDFAKETPSTIYGTYKNYTMLPIENPSKEISAGKIEINSFNFATAFISGLIILFALCSLMLGLVKRIYDLVLLFLALPLVSATIPLDDGAKFKLWRETVISKIVLAYGAVFAMCVFMLIAPMISSITLPNSGSFMNNVFRIFLICGGALTISGGQLLFARLVGGSAEEAREMAQGARTLLGGAMTVGRLGGTTGRLMFGYRNANGKRVGGLIKGGTGAVGTVAGGAVNAVGTVAGGQAYRSSAFGRGVSATQRALRGFSQGEGWLSGQGSLGGSIGAGLGKAGAKFANSNAGQASGLANGVRGAVAQGRYRHAVRQASYKIDASGTPQNAGVWDGMSYNYATHEPREDNSYQAGNGAAWSNLPDYEVKE